MSRYKWNGKGVKIEHVQVTVKENKKKPLTWYNFECLTNRDTNGKHTFPAIVITTRKGNKFIISNHYATGINKCRKGGLQGQYHGGFDFEDVTKVLQMGHAKWCPLVDRCIMFNEQAYSSNESDRREWQKENYPEEFEKAEALREIILQK